MSGCQLLYAATSNGLRNTSLRSADVLLGGQSARVRDKAIQFAHDLILVVAPVSVEIHLILALLIRADTAPIYLLGTIALSALTAIRATNLVYHTIPGHPLFEIVPIFAFVFLVSLREDFNILTMVRIREEITKLGNRRGIAAAVALTGGTVSSAGFGHGRQLFPPDLDRCGGSGRAGLHRGGQHPPRHVSRSRRQPSSSASPARTPSAHSPHSRWSSQSSIE